MMTTATKRAVLGLLILAILAAGCSPRASAPPPRAADVVHATRTGKRYHRADCEHLKSDIPMTRKVAEARGLTPCSVCQP